MGLTFGGHHPFGSRAHRASSLDPSSQYHLNLSYFPHTLSVPHYTMLTLNWGKGLVIARREEEGVVLLRVTIYSVSSGSWVGAGSVAIRRDLRFVWCYDTTVLRFTFN